jgi:prephenate dehydrogenase
MQIPILTIVGVGLIGGSIGLAAKRREIARKVRGLGRQQTSLDRALAVGAIDEAHLDPQGAVADADLIMFCTPVDQIADQVLRFAPLCKREAVLTDAGSTKAVIVERIERELPAGGPSFLGGHPLAGSEKRGPESADAELFHGRWTIVTPTPRTARRALEKVHDFWRLLGSRVRMMTPEEHDQALAVTSHLPHLVAAALAGILPTELRELTASGFRDTTRIAAGDEGLWTAIFSHNTGPLKDALDCLENRLDEFRRALEQKNAAAVQQLLHEAKEVRDALGN